MYGFYDLVADAKPNALTFFSFYFFIYFSNDYIFFSLLIEVLITAVA